MYLFSRPEIDKDRTLTPSNIGKIDNIYTIYIQDCQIGLIKRQTKV